jgi:hypothetical protein
LSGISRNLPDDFRNAGRASLPSGAGLSSIWQARSAKIAPDAALKPARDRICR